jgi:histidinol dehydrogenase
MTIVSEIKERGLDAVREWALELDGTEPTRAEPAGDVPRAALLELADRVRRWHEAQRPADISLEIEPGVTLERRWVALDTVGAYVPRNLISTLVMCAVPAQAAGVRRIVVCTPPSGAGLVAAAAEVLGLDEVWALGGPQAIGFLAYVERVDKIVGPGNDYVNEAKLEVARDVAIDLPGGPSEVVVLGDGDARLIELELAAQREHGHGAVCTTVETIEEAEAGDYATGANHVLPTNGWARSVGGLGLETFLKPVTVQRLSETGLARLRPTVEALAAAEGMPAHAEAVRR